MDTNDPWRSLKVGVATYTLRQLPLDAALRAIQRVGLAYASIKDVHLPRASTAEERRAVARRFAEAGVQPLSCGNIALPSEEAGIREAFQYARDAGIPTIVCSPHPDSFALLDRLVKEFDLHLAIHNHGPEDKRFPTPYAAMKAAERWDSRIGLCVDVGHTARAGVDPAEAIRRCRARVYDIHLKDIDAAGRPIEAGRGRLDLPAVLKALREIRFAGHVGFEYEKDATDPLPGLAESVGYVRGVLRR